MSCKVQVEIINRSFSKKRLENPRLSIRWLAQSLELSAPMMTRVLKGERKLPPKLVTKIGSLLDIDREDQERILQELLNAKGYTESSMKALLIDQIESSQRKSTVDLKWTRPSSEAFNLFRAWYFVAILDATLLKTYDGSIEFIARKLRLEVKLVEDAIRELKKFGMLELKGGKWKKSLRYLELKSSQQNLESLRRLHIDQLEKAKNILMTKTSDADRNKRLITGVTLTTSKDKVAVARMKLVEFVQELTQEMSSGDADEIYHLAVQLIPLT